MTKLSITEPEVGTKNSVADPRIPTALKEIEKVVNGELEGTNNIKAGGILEANLSAALLEKLTTKLGLTVVPKKNESFTAVSENLYEVTKEGATVELPAPTLSRMIGILCGSLINAVKVKCSSGKIFSTIHPAGETTVEVTTSSTIIVVANGSNWFVIAGQEKPSSTATTSWGAVSATGAIEASTGDFTVVKEGTGEYKIKWSAEKASAAYAVLATCEGKGFARTVTRIKGSVIVQTLNETGALTSLAFSFIAIST